MDTSTINNIMCLSCYISKNENEFYKHYRKCKECTRTKNKKAYKIYYAKNGRIQTPKPILGFGLKVLFNE
jgi:hypothetical protein